MKTGKKKHVRRLWRPTGCGLHGYHRGSVLDDYDCDIIFDFIYSYIKFQSFQKMVLSYVQILVHFAGLRHFNDEFHWTDSCSFFQGRWMSVRAGGKHPFGGLLCMVSKQHEASLHYTLCHVHHIANEESTKNEERRKAGSDIWTKN